MATMQDALKALDKYPAGALSQAVADALWPDGSSEYHTWNKPHHGGPTGGQRAAAGLLGRMARRGLVAKDWRLNDPRTWWRLTEQGRDALRAKGASLVSEEAVVKQDLTTGVRAKGGAA